MSDRPSTRTPATNVQPPRRYSPYDQFVPGELLVAFSPGTSRDEIDAAVELVDGRIASRLGAGSMIVLIRLPEGLPVTVARSRLQSIDYVVESEPNLIYRASRIPDDPQFQTQWGLDNTGQSFGTADVDINAPEAWQHTTGDRSVVVGVIDSGLRIFDFDLRDNVWRNPGEIPGNNIDDDNNGWVDDVYGIDTIAETTDVIDKTGHGTEISSVIGAKGNNGRAMAGVMWDVSIASCRFLDETGTGTLDDALQCLDYFRDLKDAGINVVATNNSWGNHQFSSLLANAISDHEARDILFVSSAGNDAQDNDINPSYPASYQNSNIISVAAIDNRGDLALFSNFGTLSVDIAAPGVDISAINVRGDVRPVSGTSLAAPFVTGVAGLIKAHSPFLSMAEVRQQILSSAVPSVRLQGRVASGGWLRADIIGLDTDGDGMPDAWEQRYGLNPNIATDAALDADADGLSNLDEYLSLTDPTLADTDGDGLSDGYEVNTAGTDPARADTDGDGLTDDAELSLYQTDPVDSDTDGDGLADGDEVIRAETDPLDPDTDADGMPDGFESLNGLDPLTADADGDPDSDGLTNSEEFALGTGPTLFDTDADGLPDGEERDIHLTDPTLRDTDDDGMDDGWEVDNALDPLFSGDADEDPDGDSFLNLEEFRAGTDPADAGSSPVLQDWSGTFGTAALDAHVRYSSQGADFRPIWQRERGYDNNLFIGIGGEYFFERDTSGFPNQLIAVRLSDGAEAWRTDFPDAVRMSDPGLIANLVIAEGHQATGVNEFGVFDADSGRLLGRFPSNDDLSPKVFTIYEDSIYATNRTEIMRLDIASGAVVWRAERSIPTRIYDEFPAVNGTHVILVQEDIDAQGTIVSGFNRQSGELDFEFDIGACEDGFIVPEFTALGGEDELFVGTQSCLFRINLATQQSDWVLVRHRWFHMSIANELIIATNDRSELVAIERDTGQVVWVRDQRDSARSLVTSQTHAFTSSPEGTSAVDLATGMEVWSSPAAGRLSLSAEGVLLVRPDNANIVAAIDVSGDTDQDGISDYWERLYKLRRGDAANAGEDPDGDGLLTLEEYQVGTNPNSVDTDEDGIRDDEELSLYRTNPLVADSDGDGLGDGDEIVLLGTHPLSADSDGDRIGDRAEIERYASDPTNPADTGGALRNYFQSFEFGTPPGWVPNEAANASWTAETAETADGEFALKSEAVEVFREAAIDWSGDFAPGELLFDARVVADSENAGAILVRIDGQLQDRALHSGTTWKELRVAVPPGEHTITFSFILSENRPSVYGLIDNLRFRVSQPTADSATHALALNSTSLWEADRSGNIVASPQELLGYGGFDLELTRDHGILAVKGPNFDFIDTQTGQTSRFVQAGIRKPVVAALDGRYVVSDATGDHGLMVVDSNGRQRAVLHRGIKYHDVTAGRDGSVYGLRVGGQIDRIDVDAASTASSATITPEARFIAVDADGTILAADENRTLYRYDANGNLLTSAQHVQRGSFVGLSIADDGRLWLGLDCSCVDYRSHIALASADLNLLDTFEFDVFDSLSITVATAVTRGGTDSDEDGLPDWWERNHGLNDRVPGDAGLDQDGDGLSAADEFLHRTHPLLADSDFDGLTDAAELNDYASDPLLYDTDSDGLSDAEEILTFGTDASMRDTDGDGLTDREEVRLYSTSPLNTDTDGDSMWDGWEIEVGLDPTDATDASLDPDADGLNNASEFSAKTDINNPDTDGDTLLDGEEVNVLGTSPVSRDTDNDLLIDNWEVDNGLNPLDAADASSDPDGDLYRNVVEYYSGTDPNSASSSPQPDPWTTYRGTSKHNSYVPLMTEGKVFRVKWREAPLDVPASKISGAVIRDDRLWVVASEESDASSVVALDLHTGNRHWTSPVSGTRRVSPPALSANAVVLIADEVDFSGSIRQFDATTGAPGQSVDFRSVDHVDYAPTIAGDDVLAFVTTDDAGIKSFDLSTGATNWSHRVFDNWNSAITVDEGQVYLFTRRRLDTVDIETGAAATIASGLPAPDFNHEFTPVLGGIGKVLGVLEDGLMQYDVDRQSVDWVVEGSFTGAPVTANGVVYVASFFDLVALDERDGSELWRWTSSSAIHGPIVITVGHALVSTELEIHAIGLNSRSSEWSYPAYGGLALGNRRTLVITGAARGDNPEVIAVEIANDLDGDGMPDDWEDQFGLDKSNPADSSGDPDGDGLQNLDEYRQGTSPLDPDTDDDGLSDGDEVLVHGSNPLTGDTDADGLSDFDEVTVHSTNPNSDDSDFDGLPDLWEVENQLDATISNAFDDADSDELTNVGEFTNGTDPNNPDTDGDGMPDGWETENELDPLTNDANGDPDSDGVSNLAEFNAGTDPQMAPPAPPPPPPPPAPPPTGSGGSGGGGGAVDACQLWLLLLMAISICRIRRRTEMQEKY